VVASRPVLGGVQEMGNEWLIEGINRQGALVEVAFKDTPQVGSSIEFSPGVFDDYKGRRNFTEDGVFIMP